MISLTTSVVTNFNRANELGSCQLAINWHEISFDLHARPVFTEPFELFNQACLVLNFINYVPHQYLITTIEEGS